MAQWNETLEPYIKVQDRVKVGTINPSAGEDLIIGVVIISDSGESSPTLVHGQSAFLKDYASRDIDQNYLASLNKLYTGEDKTIASTMWANAYRLAGSNTLLVVRATKSSEVTFARPLSKGDNNEYLLRDGELLKKVPSFKLVLDIDKDNVDHDQNGWAINVEGVGILGNRTTDEGPQYDYLVNNLKELVDKLNETGKFFSPSYKFYTKAEQSEENIATDPKDAVAVVFEEVYLGVHFLNTTNTKLNKGLAYVISCEPDWTSTNPEQKLIDLNGRSFSRFDVTPGFATNKYNSASDLKVRIRRFNHDAVVTKEISNRKALNSKSESPYSVLPNILDTFTAKGTKEPGEAILTRDFFEIAVLDPSLSDEVLFFNVGNIKGRGDMTVAEVSANLKMIGLVLPDNLHDLGLNYFGYSADDKGWVVTKEASDISTSKGTKATLKELEAVVDPVDGDVYQVEEKYYKYSETGFEQLFADLKIDPTKSKLLSVSDADLKRALDKIALDEVYTTEGLCDLGNTEGSFQNYMANLAVSQNYFYPASTLPSTNYMTIGASASRIAQDSYKIYMSAPWDLDSSTLGFTVPVSPGVIYWEAVARNRRNNSEFAGIFGQNTGIVQYQKPMSEFNKKTRQLLLSKKINTVLWNNQTNAWNMNDNYTKSSQDTIMSSEGNSRLAIRISKAMPTLLKQFIGSKISARLWADATSVIDYYFRSVILPMNFTVSDYRITINESNNPTEVQRANKMKVLIECRFQRDLKYVEVVNNLYDVGMEFTGQE